MSENLTSTPGGELNPVSISWHAMDAPEVLSALNVPPEAGLTSEEAQNRLAQYGPNELQEKKRTSFLQMLWAQINSFVIWLLIGAALISALLGDYVEAGAILLIVVLNAIMGIIQESRAEQSLAALKKLAAPEAQVLRDGHRVSLPAPKLVPGDIVFIEAGNYIPADIRLLEAVNLSIEEASLTGESVPAKKNAEGALEADIPIGDRENSAFMGTLVTYGRGKAVVTSTGMNTQLGLIASMLQTVEEEQTPLMKRLDQLGKTLGIGAIVVCVLVFIIGGARLMLGPEHISFNNPDFITEMVNLFMIAVSLAIAAVPEGLPAVVTISLAGGMREMVSRHALIRKLSSVETLGSVTVICSDKTGTLTQNEMTVTKIWVDGQFFDITGTGYQPVGEFQVDGKTVNIREYPAALTTLWVGVLNNDAQLEKIEENGGTYHIIGDPTEGSLLVAAAKADILPETMGQLYPRENEIPFDSTRKRMVTIHGIRDLRPDLAPGTLAQHGEEYTIAVKGAPDVVLNLCNRYQAMSDKEAHPLDEEARKRILDANDAMTKQALRVLGVAYRVIPAMPSEVNSDDLEKDLIFVGLIGMIDPARKEVKPALATAREAGIRTIMITGDYPNTARAIAEQIGLLRPGHGVMTGSQMNELDDDAMRREVMHTDVFARVSPEHKMRIVDALRYNQQVVAMTGDGVNDAPAIKAADIGVAMGITGTDVAKGTADMVLTDDNYASIVSAIEQGRIIYANIRKFVYFLLSSNVAEIMIIFLATLAGTPMPLTAIQLLWLNLLTDGAPALALAMEKGDPDAMQRPPRPTNEPIINGPMQAGIGVQTVLQTGAVLGAFAIGLIWELAAHGHPIPEGMTALGHILSFKNWDLVSEEVRTAETMAFVTLSLCELFRAYTVRSERASIFQLGVFSNKWMQYAVALSIVLIMLVVNVPFLQTVFETHFLTLREWGTVLGMSLIPAVGEEIYKFFLRRADHKKAALQD